MCILKKLIERLNMKNFLLFLMILFFSIASAQITVVYKKASGKDLQLDIYNSTNEVVSPTLVYIHGGSWRLGSQRKLKSKVYFDVARKYMKAGFTVISVQYRLSGIAKYPAALEDCKDAIRWIRKNANKYGI